MSDNAVPTLDAPELPLGDYRALREGRTVERVALEEKKPSEPPPAEKAPPAEGESGAGSDPADDSVEESSDSEDGGKKQEEPKGKKGLVDEVIKLRRENRELKTRGAPPPQPEQPKPASAPAEAARAVAAPADDPEPDATKYTDYDKFNRDLVRWEIRQAQRTQAAEATRREQETAQRQQVSNWQQKLTAAAAELPDFEAVAFNTTLPVSQTMGDAIMRSELGPKVLYHLGSNPAEAARIAKLAPIDQVREIGKLEASLSKPAEKPAASDEDEVTPPKPVLSKAPAPIPRPAAGSNVKTPIKNLEGMSQRDYRELRETGKLR